MLLDILTLMEIENNRISKKIIEKVLGVKNYHMQNEHPKERGLDFFQILCG
jgi:hypothetical protein